MSSFAQDITDELVGEKALSTEWFGRLVAYIVLVAGGVAAAAFPLYQTWHDFAGAFSFLESLSGLGYWAWTVIALGAITAGLVLKHLILGRETDDDDVPLALKFAVIGALAWVVSNYLA